MLVRDFVTPIHRARSSSSVASVLPLLQSGAPVALRSRKRWHYVRALDAVAMPPTRQLCDVPSRPLETLPLHAALPPTLLASHEILGATRDDRLVGVVDCSAVLSHVVEARRSGLGGAASFEELGVLARAKLMPPFLHDLANALGVMTLAIHGLRHGSEQDIDAAERVLNHTTSILEHMRALYMPQPAANHTLFNVGETVRVMEPALQLAARPAEFWMAVDETPSIVGDPCRLERALFNLVLNASEAPQVTEIRVAVAMVEAQLTLCVEDNGVGFVDHGTTSRSGVRGLGLQAVRRQVALLGGSLEIGQSSSGGARITILMQP